MQSQNGSLVASKIVRTGVISRQDYTLLPLCSQLWKFARCQSLWTSALDTLPVRVLKLYVKPRQQVTSLGLLTC